MTATAYPDALPVSASPDSHAAGIGDAEAKTAGDTLRDRTKSLYVDELQQIIRNIVGLAAKLGLPDGSTTGSVYEAILGAYKGLTTVETLSASGTWGDAAIMITDAASTLTLTMPTIPTLAAGQAMRRFLVVLPSTHPVNPVAAGGQSYGGATAITDDGATRVVEMIATDDGGLGWVGIELATGQRLSDLSAFASALSGTVTTHIADTANPHAVTAAQIGAIATTGHTANALLVADGSGAVVDAASLTSAQHGSQTATTHHATATNALNGFASSAHIATLEALAANAPLVEQIVSTSSATIADTTTLVRVTFGGAVTLKVNARAAGTSCVIRKETTNSGTITVDSDTGLAMNGGTVNASFVLPGSGQGGTNPKTGGEWLLSFVSSSDVRITARVYIDCIPRTGHPAGSILVADGSGAYADVYVTTAAMLPTVAAHTVLTRAANSTGQAAAQSVGTDEGLFNVAGVLTSQKAQTANIADNAVTLAKLATQATHTVLANVTGSTASPTASTTLALAQYAADANGSAAAPTFLVEPSGNSGLYWDATNGVVTSVDGVNRIKALVGSRTEIAGAGGVAGGAAQFTTVGVADMTLFVGTASPEASITGSPGDVFSDTTNGRLYLKRTGSGNTGWVQIDRCESGTWTPTATIVTNLDSVTPSESFYARIGDRVFWTVTGAMDPTTASPVNFRLSLPVASNFAATTDAQGVGVSQVYSASFVVADVTNDALSMWVTTSGTASTGYWASGSYEVI